jgi:hypothetical protein
MLIRTASLQVRVEDVAKAHAEVVRIAREAHGYVADTTLSAESGPAYATITIRVPSEGLESVMDRIAALGKLLQKQISAQEVTEEYVDLTSRRRNLEREEQRLLDLLQRAGKIRELLDVESTLARVRGEIEHIAGRMRYLENRVNLSTIRVQLEGPQPKVTAGGPVWPRPRHHGHPAGYLRRHLVADPARPGLARSQGGRPAAHQGTRGRLLTSGARALHPACLAVSASKHRDMRSPPLSFRLSSFSSLFALTSLPPRAIIWRFQGGCHGEAGEGLPTGQTPPGRAGKERLP